MAKNKRTKRIDAWIRRHTNHHLCACGCGEYIEIKRSHYHAGIPKFVKGHNFSSDFNPKTDVEAPELPTSWSGLSPEERTRRLAHLKNFPKGPSHPNWAGGIKRSEAGYRLVLLPEHPYSTGGYFPEHRLVVETWMRENAPDHDYMIDIDGEKFLKRTTVVHHRDEHKSNNSLSNLVLLVNQGAHLSWHMRKLEEREKFVEYSDRSFCPWILNP